MAATDFTRTPNRACKPDRRTREGRKFWAFYARTVYDIPQAVKEQLSREQRRDALLSEIAFLEEVAARCARHIADRRRKLRDL